MQSNQISGHIQLNKKQKQTNTDLFAERAQSQMSASVNSFNYLGCMPYWTFMPRNFGKDNLRVQSVQSNKVACTFGRLIMHTYIMIEQCTP